MRKKKGEGRGESKVEWGKHEMAREQDVKLHEGSAALEV